MLRLCHSTLRAGTRRALFFFSAILLASACSDDGDVTAPVPSVPTVAGTVMVSATGDPVAGAAVSIGAATATTGADGRFELTGLTAGTATLRCTAPGFEDFEMQITVAFDGKTQDIMLTPVELSTAVRVLADMSPQRQGIHVFRAGGWVGNAVVTVNGVAIPLADTNVAGPGFYQGWLPEAVAAGSPLVLEVTVNGVTVEATGNIPEAPVLTAISTFADSITFKWTSTTDPDAFEVWHGFRSFCCGSFTAPGTARELKLAASDVGELIDGDIGVFALNEGSFSGPVDSESYMSIRNGGPADTEMVGSGPSSLRINPPGFGMEVGETVQLSVTVLDQEGREIPNAVVTFSSDNEDVATVDTNGLVKAIKPSLGTWIIATSGAVSDTASAFVRALSKHEHVVIEPAKATISVGERLQLTATVLNENGNEVTDPQFSVSWDPHCEDVEIGPQTFTTYCYQDVATVNHNGIVKGVGKGSLTIYAGWEPGGFGIDITTAGWAVITVE